MKELRVGPNPTFKPKPEQEHAWKAVKAEKPKMLSYTTGMENIKNSGGMYAILPDAAPVVVASAIRLPEDMTRDELILTAMQLGIDLSKKQMKKADLVKSIRLQMDAVQLLDDDEGTTGAE